MAKDRGMVSTVLHYLQSGEELSAAIAVDLWDEYNVRNKISTLRSNGWPIEGREEPAERGGKYKIYTLDMDKSRWPHGDE